MTNDRTDTKEFLNQIIQKLPLEEDIFSWLGIEFVLIGNFGRLLIQKSNKNQTHQ